MNGLQKKTYILLSARSFGAVGFQGAPILGGIARFCTQKTE